MGCKQCAKNRQRSLEKRRAMLEAKRERLTAACENGDQGACMELQRLAAAEQYREANRFRSEHHMRRQYKSSLIAGGGARF